MDQLLEGLRPAPRGGAAHAGRRAVVAGLAAAALAAPRAGGAQGPRRIPRVVLLAAAEAAEPLKAGLADLGWVDGRSMVFEWRQSSSDAAPAAYAAEISGLQADVVVLGGPHRIRGGMGATSTVALVGVDLESDPVESGFVKSLARPGANVSGIWLDLPELAGKQLQFLRDVVAALRRVGVIWDDRVGGAQLAGADAAARTTGIALHPASIHRQADVEEAVRRLLAARAQALLVLTAPVIFSAQERIAELAGQHRLPSICPFSTYPDRGGLLAYGPDFIAIWRQAARYIDRILKGARVGDLPVERPSTFQLIVNLRAARTLGVTVPLALRARADRVIE